MLKTLKISISDFFVEKLIRKLRFLSILLGFTPAPPFPSPLLNGTFALDSEKWTPPMSSTYYSLPISYHFRLVLFPSRLSAKKWLKKIAYLIFEMDGRALQQRTHQLVRIPSDRIGSVMNNYRWILDLLVIKWVEYSKNNFNYSL